MVLVLLTPHPEGGEHFTAQRHTQSAHRTRALKHWACWLRAPGSAARGGEGRRRLRKGRQKRRRRQQQRRHVPGTAAPCCSFPPPPPLPPLPPSPPPTPLPLSLNQRRASVSCHTSHLFDEYSPQHVVHIVNFFWLFSIGFVLENKSLEHLPLHWALQF